MNGFGKSKQTKAWLRQTLLDEVGRLTCKLARQHTLTGKFNPKTDRRLARVIAWHDRIRKGVHP